MRRTFITTPLLVALLSGCAISRDYANYERPAAPIPASLPDEGIYAPLPSAAQTGLAWQRLIQDENLTELVQTALTNNRDLASAVANIGMARALYRAQRSERLPTISAGVSTGSTDVTGSSSGTNSYAANIGLSAFEIDLFGRVRSLTQAQRESYLSTRAAAESTRISLIAEIATSYVTLAADQELLALAQRTEASRERSLQLTLALNNVGLASKVDVRQAETNLASARSDIAASITQVAQDKNALALLVGVPFEERWNPPALEMVEQHISTVPIGLSSTILLARPDVMQAEHELMGANANVDAARAALFPTISLTSSLGFASNALASLFTGGAFGVPASGSASIDIFGGNKPANLEYSKAERALYRAQYEKAIQTAFREVADALARAATIDEQMQAQNDLVRSAGESLILANARYSKGIDDYFSVLDAQRTSYSAEQSRIATLLAKISNRITQYRVIGNDRDDAWTAKISTR